MKTRPANFCQRARLIGYVGAAGESELNANANHIAF